MNVFIVIKDNGTTSTVNALVFNRYLEATDSQLKAWGICGLDMQSDQGKYYCVRRRKD